MNQTLLPPSRRLDRRSSGLRRRFAELCKVLTDMDRLPLYFTLAALLTFAQYAKPRQKETISWGDAMVIGTAQAVATMPGLSRSGTTIATGLILGNKRAVVAEFSFLMVILPILGQSLLDLMGGNFGANLGVGFWPLCVGFVTAFVSGCLACKFMLNIVNKGKLIWFAVYCLIVGLVSIGSYIFESNVKTT